MSQLVAKTMKELTLPLVESQARLYKDTLLQAKAEVSGNKKGLKGLNQKKLQNLFTQLRKIALHPLLIRHVSGGVRGGSLGGSEWGLRGV
jgi:SNF2 family DNA or RNA helicase